MITIWTCKYCEYWTFFKTKVYRHILKNHPDKKKEKDNYTITCKTCENKKIVNNKHESLNEWQCDDCKKV